MSEHEPFQGEHYNSLGYTIQSEGWGSTRPMIVWGNREDGTRINISDARKGAIDKLACECGALLVARKGEERAHHFAHESGGVKECKEAQLGAICQFLCNTLQPGSILRLPAIEGRVYEVPVTSVRCEEVGDIGSVRIDVSGRELVLVCPTKQMKGRKLKALEEQFAKEGQSGILIDLSTVRNRHDDLVAKAILTSGERAWLFNARAVVLAEEARRRRAAEWEEELRRRDAKLEEDSKARLARRPKKPSYIRAASSLTFRKPAISEIRQALFPELAEKERRSNSDD